MVTGLDSKELSQGVVHRIGKQGDESGRWAQDCIVRGLAREMVTEWILRSWDREMVRGLDSKELSQGNGHRIG